MGAWHELVPRDPEENVRWRLDLYCACAQDPLLRSGIKQLCREDITFWADAFLWQFNPFEKGKKRLKAGPWVCWDFQP